jgi:hypothetical protein
MMGHVSQHGNGKMERPGKPQPFLSLLCVQFFLTDYPVGQLQF